MGNHRTYKGFCGDAEMKLGGNTILSSLGAGVFLLQQCHVRSSGKCALSPDYRPLTTDYKTTSSFLLPHTYKEVKTRAY